MSKKTWKIIISITVCLVLLVAIIFIIQAEDGDLENLTFKNQLLLDSMLYTGVDDLSENIYKGELKADDELIKVSNNGKYNLYFNSKLCIFKVKNNSTGYIYASALDEIDESTSTEFYAGFLSSSFSIYYYQQLNDSNAYNINTKRAWLTKGVKLRAAEKEGLPEAEQTKVKINIAEKTEYNYQITNGTVKVSIKYANAKEVNTDRGYSLGITVNYYVSLDDDGLHVKAPRDEIKEEDVKYRLAGIVMMPLMGATYNNQTPGYMLIPDGAGALVRYGSINPSTATQMNYDFFGSDDGSQTQGLVNNKDFVENKTLTAPTFGFINGINQDGILAILENGATQANLTVSPCGAYNIKENLMFATFKTRFNYYLYGINSTLVDELFNDDYQMTYRFVEGNNANYVGLALTYQNYLVNQNLLNKSSSNEFKMQIDFLMSDIKTSILGYSTIKMTSLNDTKKIVSELSNQGIKPMIVFKGWSSSGFSGVTPYKLSYNTKVSSRAKFKNYLNELENLGINAYLYDDLVISYQKGNASKGDIARSILRLRMTFTDNSKYLFAEYNYLNPEKTSDLANTLIKKGERKLGIDGLAIDSIGTKLFSYYDHNQMYTRFDVYQKYQDAANDLSTKYALALYNPNSYMWQYTKEYLDMPVYANAYHLYSDNVPFIPYVLKGYIDYYGEYLNFSSLGEVGILRMLDYGCFPSYILTSEISHNLKFTNAESYFTTAYADWKDEIIRVNAKYQEGYTATLNSTVKSRIIPEVGVSIVTYQNMNDGSFKTLIINYKDISVNYANTLIQPMSYIVLGGLYE